MAAVPGQGPGAGASACHTRVLVRVRPLAEERTQERCLEPQGSTSLHIRAERGHLFSSDQVLGEEASQEDAYAAVMQGVVQDLLRGVNMSVLAYGQTGSGKTHSLFGDMSRRGLEGIVPRAVHELFNAVLHLGQDSARPPSCQLTVSVVEVYCERIRDLLSDSPELSEGLAVQQDRVRGIVIPGACELAVSSAGELMRVIQLGLTRRMVAATGMNAASSRSHCVVLLRLAQAAEGGRTLHSKLCLVDLAGSERQDRTHADSLTLDEGRMINKSLSAVSNVVCALTDGSAHIPYRDSKLTRVLQDSLGGNAKVVLLVCCSPSSDDASETLSSLRFGSRARGIINTVQANSARKGPADDDAARLLAAARQECEQLRSELASLRLCAAAGAAAHDVGGQMTSRKQEGPAACVSMLDAWLSVPVICALQGLCALALIALHAWPPEKDDL